MRGSGRGGISAGVRARGYQCGGQGAVDARGCRGAGVRARGYQCGGQGAGVAARECRGAVVATRWGACARAGIPTRGLIASRRHHKYSFDGTP